MAAPPSSIFQEGWASNFILQSNVDSLKFSHENFILPRAQRSHESNHHHHLMHQPTNQLHTPTIPRILRILIPALGSKEMGQRTSKYPNFENKRGGPTGAVGRPF
jgi:hypothetical protein